MREVVPAGTAHDKMAVYVDDVEFASQEGAKNDGDVDVDVFNEICRWQEEVSSQFTEC